MSLPAKRPTNNMQFTSGISSGPQCTFVWVRRVKGIESGAKRSHRSQHAGVQIIQAHPFDCEKCSGL